MSESEKSNNDRRTSDSSEQKFAGNNYRSFLTLTTRLANPRHFTTAPSINDNGDADTTHANVVAASSAEGKRDALEIPEGPVHYRVSSAHLISASSYFRNMLSGEKWKEGVRKTDNCFYIT